MGAVGFLADALGDTVDLAGAFAATFGADLEAAAGLAAPEVVGLEVEETADLVAAGFAAALDGEAVFDVACAGLLAVLATVLAGVDIHQTTKNSI